MEGFEYETALKDGMSATAHAETQALDGLSHALEGVTAHTDHATHALTEHAKAHKSHHEYARFSIGSVHEFTESLVPEILVAELAAEAIKKLGEALLEGAHFAVEAAEFKENTIAAYEAVKGSAEEGEKAFAEIDKLSRNIHMPAEKAHELAKSLLVQGLENQEAVTSAIQATSNLQRIGLEQGASKLQRIIETSLASGHLALSPKMLRGTGASIETVYDELGKRLHMGRDQVKSQLAAGKVDATTGINAITEAINSGNVGEIASKKWDITDAVTDFKNSIRSIFQDVDAGPLKQALFDFVSLFSTGSTTGQQMHDVVTAALNGIVKWIGKAIESTIIFGLKLEVLGLEAYIKLFPIVDAFVRIEHAVTRAYDKVDAFVQKVSGSSIGENVLQTIIPGYGLAKAVGGLLGGGGPAAAPVVEPPHAGGGVVHSPPPGESFAAVAPGEMILPEMFTTPLLALGKGGGASKGTQDVNVEIHWAGDVVVHGGGDPAEVREAVTTALADQLEQLALELGG